MARKINLYVSLIFFLFGSIHTVAQEFVWAQHFGGKGTSSITRLTPGTNINKGIALDMNNNVYAVGWFDDSVDFDPGTSEHYLVGKSEDGYVVKLNEQGEFEWVFSLSSDLRDEITAIAFDAANNFYIVGQCQGKVDFDPSPAVYELNSEHGGANFMFLAKYNADGQLLWANSMSGNYFGVHGYAIAIDQNNDVLITGSLYDQVDFDPTPTIQWAGGNKQGIFFAKYSSAGALHWAKSIDGLGTYGGGSDIAVSPLGNVFITGFFGNAADFDPSSADSIIVAGTTADRFFAKYDAQGNFRWARSINTNNNGVFSVGRACQLVVTANEDITLAGDFSGDVDFNPGPGTFTLSSPGTYSTYLAQYRGDGSFLWANAIYGGFCIPSELALDCENNLVVTGCFKLADFDTGFDIDLIQSEVPSAFNNFLAKYAPHGEYLWAEQMGNNGYGSGIIIPTLAVKEGFQYVGGGFKQKADFDPDSTESNKQATGIGHNSFVAKYKRVNQFLVADTVVCSGQEVLLVVNAPNATFLWQDGSTQSTFLATGPGNYAVQINIGACTFVENVLVREKLCAADLVMPNVFSPNQDGVNDFFAPIQWDGILDYKISVFNRWGGAVYVTNNILQGWDGTYNAAPCAAGVYFWVVEFKDAQNVIQNQSGNVTLLR